MRLLTEIETPFDLTNALREARLRLDAIAWAPPISPAAIFAVAEYIGSIERDVMDEHWEMEDIPVTLIPRGNSA